MIRLLGLPLSAALLLSGCAYHRVVVPIRNETGTLQSVQSTAFAGVTRRTEANCPTNLLNEVRVRQSFGEALVTVLTLGLVAPARVQYLCAKIPTAEGDTDH
ncbi:MAG TPA: hypothetical protein VMG08_04920 [Allosphingosinicella sp.]|nr:hypothetical protein [Allosphingosinicella sp.]